MGFAGRRAVALAAAITLAAPVLAACSSTGGHKPASSSDCVAAAVTPTMKIPLSSIYVNVLNAGGGNGQAAKVSSQLRWRGIHVITTGNDQSNGTPPAYAEIVYGPNGKQIALTLAQQIQHAKLVQDTRTNPSVDVVIGTHFALVPVPPPPPSKITVDVLNAFVIPGSAGDVAAELTKRGFHVAKVGNDRADFFPDNAVIVRYGLQGEPAGRRVALQFHGVRMIQDNRKDATVDVVLGSKWTAGAVVPAAQATPTPTPTTPKPSCVPVKG